MTESITTEELQTLLTDLQNGEKFPGLKLRTFGDVWSPNFLTVIQVKGREVTLKDNKNQKSIMLPDLSQVVQIELRSGISGLQACQVYQVKPTAWKNNGFTLVSETNSAQRSRGASLS